MEIAKSLGIKPPVPAEHVVRYMMGKPLDFDPGQRFAYSNLGYLVLGRVIEAASGRGYEAFVRKDVLAPLGVESMQLGRALPENRANAEVSYVVPKKQTGPCLYEPRVGEDVPLPDGADNFEAFEAHGGWIASAPDLVRFAAAFHDPAKCPLLKKETVAAMWARPAGAAGKDDKGKPADDFSGCGWSVRPVGADGRLNAWHAGLISGSEALLVRRCDGLAWAVVFNADRLDKDDTLAGLIDPLVHDAADAVKAWPGGR